ncbi:hypothetical protein AB0K49_18250 [Streptomyces decoyicus]|uniref:hypothetical protein n=1 Tax=Streptomyces decoyicus TaxID=249567 RepID=UPI00345C72D8
MADLLTPHLHSGGPGPERKITVLGLLVGLHLACAGSGGQRVHLAEAARILGWWIPAQARERLGITDVPAVETASAFEALEGRVRRLFHDIETVCDPSPLPKNRRLDREEAQRLRDADAPERAERARQLLTAVCNQILEASLTPVRPCLTAGWAGSCAVDGTAFATFARGVKTTGALTATDPDAGWYVRDGDHHDPDTLPGSGSGSGKKRSRRSRRVKMLFGYETTLEIVAPTVLHPAAGLPAGTRPPARGHPGDVHECSRRRPGRRRRAGPGRRHLPPRLPGRDTGSGLGVQQQRPRNLPTPRPRAGLHPRLRLPA